MVNPQLRFPTTTDFEILINNSLLPTEYKFQVAEMTIEDDVNLPSMFALEFAGLEHESKTSQNKAIDEIDDSLFQIGNAVEVRLTAGNRLIPLIKGEITGLEPEFVVDRRPSLLVRGYDRRHRLQRGRKTRTFVQSKDSAIAAIIANEAGLTPQVQDSQETHEYVLQANQNDLEFLLERASRIHYEVIVDHQTFFFQPVANNAAESLTLNFENDLLEFYPRLSSIGQVTEVNVQGWDGKKKQEITFSSSTAISNMGGENTGAAISQNVFGQAVDIVSDRPVSTLAEAQQMASAYFNQSILEFITGEGVCQGRADLRAGKVVKIDGIGKQFSGLYYVISASHRYTQNGYYTHFNVRRNSV